MSTEDQKAREAFEAWHIARQRRRGYGERLQDAEFVGRHANGKYSSLGLEDAWEAWKASRAALMSNAAPEVDRSAVRREAFEEAAKACEAEALLEEMLWEDDRGYNMAISHCAAAIRALADPLQGKETP